VARPAGPRKSRNSNTASSGDPPGEGSIVTTTNGSTDRQLDRWSGGSFIAAGLLLVPVAMHPNVFESTFAHAALHTMLWVPMHAALVVAMILSLVGLLGLYARHAAEPGWLGAVGLAAAVTGMVMAACAFYWEAFVLSPIARRKAELFAWNGPIVTDWGVRTGALAGLWVIGLALLGVARGGPASCLALPRSRWCFPRSLRRVRRRFRTNARAAGDAGLRHRLRVGRCRAVGRRTCPNGASRPPPPAPDRPGPHWLRKDSLPCHGDEAGSLR
jgi:hypothetical protein